MRRGTWHAVSTRLQEHQRYTRNAEVLRKLSDCGACVWLGTSHRWHGPGVIEQKLDCSSRKMEEALYICMEKQKGAVMNSCDGWRIKEAWQAVIDLN